MVLPLRFPYPPAEAQLDSILPAGSEWQHEPKWDGFRCLSFRDGKKIDLQAKSGKSLTRYFPELVEAVARVSANRFVLDGEIVVSIDGELSFDELLMRIHPAESRVSKLARAHPCTYIVLALLVAA